MLGKKDDSLTVRQKLVLLKWMDFQYSKTPTPNLSDACKRTGISRTMLREWYGDREIIKNRFKK